LIQDRAKVLLSKDPGGKKEKKNARRNQGGRGQAREGHTAAPGMVSFVAVVSTGETDSVKPKFRWKRTSEVKEGVKGGR